jgi:glutamine amidotransferase
MDADRVVLPGVGAFADCMANLARYNLIDPIQRTIASGKPFLGICLGLQLLFTESEEFGLHKGLDIIPGRVKRFQFSSGSEAVPPSGTLKIPHMGWNSIEIVRPAPVFHGIATGSHCYFVHSYYVEPDEPEITATVTDYGGPFVSAIWRDNVIACQFHPEKSQAIGLQVIKNFGAWAA